MPDARRAARLAPHGRRRRDAAGSAARPRPEDVSDAPVKARAVDARRCRCCSRRRLKDPAFLDALAALGADLGVVAAYGKILTDAVLATPRLGHDQRPRVAAAAVSRRGAGASRGHRRRTRDRRHDHARREGARRRARCSRRRAGRSGPTRPATRSSAISRSSAPACWSTTLDALAGGPRRTKTPQDDSRARPTRTG